MNLVTLLELYFCSFEYFFLSHTWLIYVSILQHNERVEALNKLKFLCLDPHLLSCAPSVGSRPTSWAALHTEVL